MKAILCDCGCERPVRIKYFCPDGLDDYVHTEECLNDVVRQDIDAGVLVRRSSISSGFTEADAKKLIEWNYETVRSRRGWLYKSGGLKAERTKDPLQAFRDSRASKDGIL